MDKNTIGDKLKKICPHKCLEVSFEDNLTGKSLNNFNISDIEWLRDKFNMDVYIAYKKCESRMSGDIGRVFSKNFFDLTKQDIDFIKVKCNIEFNVYFPDGTSF